MLYTPQPAVVAVAAALALLQSASVVPSPSADKSRSAPICVDVLFMGVHGLGEGPDENYVGQSNTINAIESAFSAYQQQHGTDIVDQISTIKYSAPLPSDLKAKAAIKAAEERAVAAMSKEYNARAAGCPTRPKVVLAGYSLGAWAVDDWVNQFNPKLVLGVALLGDPQNLAKEKVKGTTYTWQGLARRWTDYAISPYPNKVLRDTGRLKTWCLPGDPVCGRGFTDKKKQLGAALNCTISACIHFFYGTSGKAKEAGNFLGAKAFGP
jgi:hypothetical protein